MKRHHKTFKDMNRFERRKIRAINKKNTINFSEYEKIFPPETLSFEMNPKETRKFFLDLRERVDYPQQNSQPISIELKSIKKIDLGAALVLVAEFDRWQRNNFVKLRPNPISEWDPDVLKKLVSLGFFKILKSDVKGKLPNHSDTQWIQFISGTATVGKAASTLRTKLSSLFKDKNKWMIPIYVPLIESMKNSAQHAYIYDNVSWIGACGKRWWMAADYDERINIIEVAFLDLGVGIPRSMIDSPYWDKATARGKKISDMSDAEIINLCLRYGFSRLGQDHRGKGFENITKVTETIPGSSVTIVSGKGTVYSGMISERRGWEFNHPLGGTLIRWYIRVPKF